MRSVAAIGNGYYYIPLVFMELHRMQVTINPEMSCDVVLREQGAWEGKEGPYVDLKQNPHDLYKLPEAKQWPELGTFLLGVNALPLFRTSGCKAMGETPGGYGDPFVDISFADIALAKSELTCVKLAISLQALDADIKAEKLVLELCLSYAHFPGGLECCALRVWLRGPKAEAQMAFSAICRCLNSQDEAPYREIVAAEQMLQQHFPKFRAPFSSVLPSDLTAEECDLAPPP